MTNQQCTLLMNAGQNFAEVAKSYGFKVAGPSERGGFLVCDVTGRAWLFSPMTPDNPMKPAANFGRTVTESVWSELNVSRMNQDVGRRRGQSVV